MKGKKEDKQLRELFRRKLEGVEIFPSPVVKDDLFRRLGRKEFLRFNPARFNVWYAGAIVAAGVAAALIFYRGNGFEEKNEIRPAPKPDSTIIEESIRNIESNEKKTDTTGYFNINRAKSDKSEISEEHNITKSISGNVKNLIPDITSATNVKTGLVKNNILPGGDIDTGKLENIKQTSGLIKTSVTKGCCPLKVKFQSMAPSFDHCRWTFGDGGNSAEINPDWIYDNEGEYKVTFQTYSSEGLLSVATCIITVYPKPVARFDIIAENAGMPDDKVSFLNYSTDGIKFLWNFGDGNTSDLFEPVHTYKQSGNYDITLVVISEHGCTDTMTYSNAFKGSGNYIKFPNAFFPNLNGPTGGYYSSFSDDAANVFHPVSSGVSEYQLRIFSKSGVLIFESNDINIGWDGYYKGQLCNSGVYIWKVRGNYINGEPFTIAGDLTLIKN